MTVDRSEIADARQGAMTLLPQGLGLAVAAIGLALVAYALFATGGAYRNGDG